MKLVNLLCFILPYLFFSQREAKIVFVQEEKITDSALANKSGQFFGENLLESMNSALGLDIKSEKDNGEKINEEIINEVGKKRQFILELKDNKAIFYVEGYDNEISNKKVVDIKNNTFYYGYPYNDFKNSENNAYSYYDDDNNIKIIELKEFPEDKKNIMGYSCFKVKMKFKEKFSEADDLEVKDLTSFFDTFITEREMYVTKDVKLMFHPFFNNVEILKKYYPLEIIDKLNKLEGMQTENKVEFLELKN